MIDQELEVGKAVYIDHRDIGRVQVNILSICHHTGTLTGRISTRRNVRWDGKGVVFRAAQCQQRKVPAKKVGSKVRRYRVNH